MKLEIDPAVAQALAAGPAGRRPGIDADLSRSAAPAQPRTCAGGRGGRARRAARCRPRSPSSTAASAIGLDDVDAGAAGRRPTTSSNARRATWPLVLAQGRLGATTVAGTIRLAAAAGIRVMATGGIGGVHRGGEHSLDVSADLHELARTRRRRGLQRRQDHPRPAANAGGAGDPGGAGGGLSLRQLPGLLRPRQRAAGAPRRRARPAGRAWCAPRRSLGWPSGMVVANPPPAELALPRGRAGGVDRGGTGRGARARYRRQGRDTVPAGRARPASDGRTVALNEALVLDNARLAARLASHAAIGALARVA